MNKRTLLIAGLAALAGTWAYFNFSKKPAAPAEPTLQPIAASTGAEFATATDSLLSGYYQLKDAFVKSDTTTVNTAAAQFLNLLSALPNDGIKGDTALVKMAGDFKQTVTAETKNILALGGLDSKRRSFQPLSDALFDLLRTIKYTRTKVYQQYCPMAFDNAGAAWLSNSSEVVNPYFGDEMLHCGDVRDSIRQ